MMDSFEVSKSSVLIVDDKPDNLTVLRQMLVERGYRVRAALSGELALQTINTSLPDVILLDIMMPGMGGYGVCRRLKADERTRDIPVLFISALDAATDKVAAFEAGGIDFITKPFQEEEVLARVKTHLALRNMQKRLEEKNLRFREEIDERKRVEEKLRKLSRAVEQSASSIVITDIDGRIEYVNPAFSQTTGYSYEEAVGNNPRVLKSGKHPSGFYKEMWQKLSSGNVWQGELVNKRKDGELYWESATISPIKNREGNITHYVAVKDDITLRKKVEEENIRLLEEAKKAREEAESANSAKSSFLASMSHEIRTPMNAVIGMTELTLQTDLTPEQRENLRIAKISAHHLLDIINDILDLSKIEAGKIMLEDTDFDLHRLLDSVIRIFSVQVKKQGLFLNLACSDDVPQHIRGDQVRLRQILVNLIGNALKFTETGGITVRANLPERSLISNPEPPGHSLIFSVTDTGIGIPEDTQEKIFDSFSQASDSTTRKYGGTGLGLTICRQLTELMGGRIRVESEVGSGSTFSFQVVFQPGNKENIRPDDQRHMAPEQALENLKILLAEDNPLNAKVATSFLTRMGHIPVTAGNGKEVLAALSTDTFDLVLMDVEMPEMDGLEATQRIRSGEAGLENRSIPVIAMTAHVMAEFREKCEAAGMNGFVTKPVDFYELGTIIERHVSGAAVASETDEREKPVAWHPVLDKKDLMRRIGGDETLFDTLCNLFIQEIPKIKEKLRLAISANNMEEIRVHAHFLRGMCGNMSAKSCQELARQLECISEEGDGKSEQIRQVFEKLDQEFSKLIATIFKIGHGGDKRIADLPDTDQKTVAKGRISNSRS
ncbi:response regulator [Desulfococcaceae bacterium HSG8]|nr:response regulator [Desulfococcaceae bacterium HSG8]